MGLLDKIKESRQKAEAERMERQASRERTEANEYEAMKDEVKRLRERRQMEKERAELRKERFQLKHPNVSKFASELRKTPKYASTPLKKKPVMGMKFKPYWQGKKKRKGRGGGMAREPYYGPQYEGDIFGDILGGVDNAFDWRI